LNFRVVVEVSGLEGIADPEGQTIERALPLLGFEGIGHVRVGRLFRFEIEADDEAAARQRSAELCDRLLANPVIQRAELTVLPSAPAVSAGEGSGDSP
jgi:phosphoribosylformylglycinamidine synthase